MNKRSQTTISDVAIKAGVSIATASKALRDLDVVSPKTKEKVLAAARDLHYQVDRNARNLRLQRSYTVGVMLYEDKNSLDPLGTPFILDMMRSISSALLEQGYDMLFSSQQASEDWYEDFIRSGRVDGFIVLGGYDDYAAYRNKLAELQRHQVAFVDWGVIDPHQSHCTVGIDNQLAAYKAVTHLIELGKKRIAYLGPIDQDNPEMRARQQGYLNALQDARYLVDNQLLIQTLSTTEAAYQSTQFLLNAKVEFDAVFAASDVAAMSVINTLRRSGLNVPDDIAVVGFDDISIASYFSPTLTSVKQNIHEGGRLMVEKLINLLDGKEVQSILLDTEVIKRESTGHYHS